MEKIEKKLLKISMGCFLYAFLAHAECGDGTGK